MDNDNFPEEKRINGKEKINVFIANAFGLLLFFGLWFSLPKLFWFLWPGRSISILLFPSLVRMFEPGITSVIISVIVVLLLVFVPMAIIHEFIHGFFFAIFCNNKFKSVKLGIMPARKLFTPYCRCIDPIKIGFYRIAGIMPLIILGLFPIAISFVIGNGALLSVGIIGITLACGDILMFFKTLKYKKDNWIPGLTPQ